MKGEVAGSWGWRSMARSLQPCTFNPQVVVEVNIEGLRFPADKRSMMQLRSILALNESE